MIQKNPEVYENLIHTLESSRPDDEKFMILKALDYYLLEYQLFPEHLKCEYGVKISLASGFIHSYFSLELREYNKEAFQQLVKFSLQTLHSILQSNKKQLDDIPEFRFFSRYYNYLKDTHKKPLRQNTSLFCLGKSTI